VVFKVIVPNDKFSDFVFLNFFFLFFLRLEKILVRKLAVGWLGRWIEERRKRKGMSEAIFVFSYTCPFARYSMSKNKKSVSTRLVQKALLPQDPVHRDTIPVAKVNQLKSN
jgi:hypothetical protein